MRLQDQEDKFQIAHLVFSEISHCVVVSWLPLITPEYFLYVAPEFSRVGNSFAPLTSLGLEFPPKPIFVQA